MLDWRRVKTETGRVVELAVGRGLASEETVGRSLLATGGGSQIDLADAAMTIHHPSILPSLPPSTIIRSNSVPHPHLISSPAVHASRPAPRRATPFPDDKLRTPLTVSPTSAPIRRESATNSRLCNKLLGVLTSDTMQVQSGFLSYENLYSP